MNPLDTSATGRSGRSPRSAIEARRNTQGDGTAERPSLEESTSEDVELDNLSEDGLQDDEETGLTGKSKGKRRQRRRTNTLLDNRIASEIKVTAEEKKEADQTVLKKSVVNVILIGLWYLFSLSISIVRSTPEHKHNFFG